MIDCPQSYVHTQKNAREACEMLTFRNFSLL